MVVNPSITPTLSISAHPGDTVCSGTVVTYSVIGGIMPYQWAVNGSLISGSTGGSYTYAPANADSIVCAVPAIGCNLAGSSNTIHMTVSALAVPTISITASPTVAAVGSTVTVTATFTAVGSGYTINWYDNGSLLTSGTGSAITYTKTADTDHITATLLPDVVYPYCFDTATSIVVVVTNDLGIASPVPIQKGRLEIYPNPAQQMITVCFSEPIMSIEISNVYGQVVHPELCTPTSPAAYAAPPSKGEYQHELIVDVSSLPAGLYIVKVNGIVQKVVKE